MEARERLARAIQECELDWVLWDALPENGATKKHFRRVAAAAIKALHLSDAAALALMDGEGMRVLRNLTRDASEVARLGAATGPQWTRMASSLIVARALLSKLEASHGSA